MDSDMESDRLMASPHRPTMGPLDRDAGMASPSRLELGESPRRVSSRTRLPGARASCFGWCSALPSILRNWWTRKFMSGVAVLFPLVITVYATWWFLEFFDNFFSPIYEALLGVHIFGLGFLTSMAFIFVTGVFTTSWVGSWLHSIGEWIIARLPGVKHIYSTAKQISAAVSPQEDSKAFKECVVIRHPRSHEFAFGFITGEMTMQFPEGPQDLFTVFVPTNHVYIGDVFILKKEDVFHTDMTVRQGLEVVISCGMAVPSHIKLVDGSLPSPWKPQGPWHST